MKTFGSMLGWASLNQKNDYSRQNVHMGMQVLFKGRLENVNLSVNNKSNCKEIYLTGWNGLLSQDKT